MICVRVFTQERCPQCRATLRRFAKWGAGIGVTSALDHLDYLHGLGLKTAPGVVVTEDGRVLEAWGGFSQSRVDKRGRALAAQVYGECR